ncbi:MAG: LmbE family protein [Sporomusa sp.]|jgi:4-oxalomesaconate hydratase|nr:LmbE family protein [Sporomusa sp.]MDF2875021.1 LmbE family protein [Sporomusa sp.]
MSGKKMLIVAAHMGDFLWRCGGTIAKHAKAGDEVHVVVLSYGLRGESNELWKIEGMTKEQGRMLRKSESEEAAKMLGINNIELWDYEDYPFETTRDKLDRLVVKLRTFRPDFIVTHDKIDAFNPDHGLVSAFVVRACQVSSGAGVVLGDTEVGARRIPIFGYEHHYPELCDFKPGVFVDITDVFELKLRAMGCYKSQAFMAKQYVARAELRGSQCSSFSGNKKCKYAEAFTIFYPIAQYGDLVY